MTLEVLSFILGAILLAVGVLGGGIEVKEIKIPKVTRLVRILSASIGLVFILLGLWIAEIVPRDKGREPPAPDLIIESLTHSPKNPTTEDTITLTAVVKNTGSGTASSSILALKVKGETVPATYSVPALEPGKTHTVERPLTLSVAQAYYTTATADLENQVDESDETNNQKTDDYRVVRPVPPKLPDLIIESLTHSPKNPTTEDTITLTAVVKNTGSGTASSSTLALKVKGETVPATYSVPALEPGKTHTVERPLTLSVAQAYYTTATADLENQVDESDETNNQKTDDYRVVRLVPPKLPDLIIESLTHSPETPTTADTITFTAAVKNIGGGKAGRSTLALKVGGETVPKTYPVPALEPGQRYRVQRRSALSVAQRYRNTAMADFKNQVRESNETNNQKTDDYRLIPKPPPRFSAPRQLSPANGTVFNHFPRRTTLKWTAVPGATSYTVETAFKSRDTWSSPRQIPNIQTTTYTFNFVGAQPGRWRVWAVGPDGQESSKTGWWEFRYTR